MRKGFSPIRRLSGFVELKWNSLMASYSFIRIKPDWVDLGDEKAALSMIMVVDSYKIKGEQGYQ